MKMKSTVHRVTGDSHKYDWNQDTRQLHALAEDCFSFLCLWLGLLPSLPIRIARPENILETFPAHCKHPNVLAIKTVNYSVSWFYGDWLLYVVSKKISTFNDDYKNGSYLAFRYSYSNSRGQVLKVKISMTGKISTKNINCFYITLKF